MAPGGLRRWSSVGVVATIHMYLPDEAVEVWRPIEAEPVGDAFLIVTDSDANDSAELAPLVATTAKRFTMAETSADNAYLSHANLCRHRGGRRRSVHSVQEQ
jgi:hypothetical protein